jgi:hypothetical protein
MTISWDEFYVGVTGFAGTLFAITLVARTIRQRDEGNESLFRNQTRMWESIGVTFELAAAALLALLVTIRGTVPASILASTIVCVGVLSYALYIRAYRRQQEAGEDHSRLDRWLFWVTALPLSAYILSAFYFWNVEFCTGPSCLRVDEVLFPLSVGYLVFSGLGQAFLWYIRSWEIPVGGQQTP